VPNAPTIALFEQGRILAEIDSTLKALMHQERTK